MSNEKTENIVSTAVAADDVDKQYYVKIPTRKKFSYAGIELASQFSWTIMSSFLMVYLTDSLLIPAGMVSIMFLICRVWDAVNDPFIGMVSDRTRSKWGRYRPYIMFCSLPLFICTVLLFIPLPGWGVKAKFTYVFIVYFILVFLYTAVNLCTGSLNAVMTQDPAERGSVAAFRLSAAFIGGTLVMIVISYFEPILAEKHPGWSWFILVLILAIIAVPMQVFGAKSQKEIVPPSKKVKVPLKDLLYWSFKNKEFLKLAAIFFFMGISWYGMLTVEYYWFIYVVGNGQLYGLANIIGLIPAALGMIVAPYLGNKFRSKGKAVILLYALYGIFNFISYFIFKDSNMNIAGMIVMLGLVTLFMVSAQSMLYGMVPDTVEYGELISDGLRMDGFINTLVSFWNKIGISIGTAATGWVLAAAGYLPTVAEQPQSTITAMNVLRWLMPAGASIVIILLTLTYKIDYKKFDEIVAALQKRKAEKENASA